MSEYTIAVTIQHFKRITETLAVDKSNKDKFHIRGNYISFIEPYINSHEQLNVKLKPSNAVIYKIIERESTPYLRINANFTLCSETNKYLILIKDKPNENEQKEKRETIAKEIDTKYSGSSKKYRLDQLSKGFEPSTEEAYHETSSTQDKEENHSIKILPNNEKERPKYSFDYLANVITVGETIKNFIKGQVLNTEYSQQKEANYSVNGYILSSNDLMILEKKKAWLNEGIIEAYVSLFSNPNDTFIIASSTAYQILINANMSTGEFYCLDPKQQKTENEAISFKNWVDFMSSKEITTEWRIRKKENRSRQKQLEVIVNEGRIYQL
ncbi:unnamed protein product [Brachionus calyciflorus]|uniref:Uncharacterized protein n=1 Tax=Brachionus calyciflorus TaxID=104777 RepID=A0A814EC36_9BILA|nr:unnamed protein product [Brachionus calyciflorus]